MRYMKPSYYDGFRCLADKCPSSCCEGWQIAIDEKSLVQYLNWEGKLRGRLLNSIDWEEGTFLQYDRKCAFLNEKSLCDLQAEAGEQALCRTCREYPRHIEEFEGVREYSLSLSCPEAARIMLTEKEKSSFIQWEDLKEEAFEEEFDFLLYTRLLEAREVLFSILETRELPFSVRMEECLFFAERLQRLLEKGDFAALEEWTEGFVCDIGRGKNQVQKAKARRFENMQKNWNIFIELEHLEKSWEERLKHVNKSLYLAGKENYDACYEEFLQAREKKDVSSVKWDRMMEKIAVFFIYTYFCGAVYDDAVYSKVLLTAFSTSWIEEFMLAEYQEKGEVPEEEDMISMAYRYAREIEHSDQNLNALEDWFWEISHP